MANKNYSVGAYFHQSAGGLTVYTVDANDKLKDHRTDVITAESITDLTFAYAFKGRFQVGALLPIFAMISGDGIDQMANPPQNGVSKTSLGDAWLEFKWLAHGNGQDGLSIAVAPAITLPTSGGKDFTGEKTPSFRPRVDIENKHGKMQFAADLGLVFRAPRTLFSSNVGQELSYGFGAGYKVSKPFSVYAELTGRNGFSSKLTSSPMELDGGIKLRVMRGVTVMVGGGTGLIKGIGSPSWRAFAGVGWSPGHEGKDTDGDGVLDEDEGTDAMGRSCITIPEDRDGFEDDDGCPDPDNDDDGIPDDHRQVPERGRGQGRLRGRRRLPGSRQRQGRHPGHQGRLPERRRGHRRPSAEGRLPRPTTTTATASPTRIDKCPNEPRTATASRTTTAAPTPDNDDDGIPDDLDKCPNDAEDKDGFEDEDGCPDPDNDKRRHPRRARQVPARGRDDQRRRGRRRLPRQGRARAGHAER